jgi:hypothetical protein
VNILGSAASEIVSISDRNTTGHCGTMLCCLLPPFVPAREDTEVAAGDVGEGVSTYASAGAASDVKQNTSAGRFAAFHSSSPCVMRCRGGVMLPMMHWRFCCSAVEKRQG